jgi:hypothetical protein
MYAASGNTFYGWGNMVVSDAMGNWLKCFATIAVMITMVYGRPAASATCCAAVSSSRCPCWPCWACSS